MTGSGTLALHMPSGQVTRLRLPRTAAIAEKIAGCAGPSRTADVIAETETVVYRKGETLMHETAADAPGLAEMPQRIVASTPVGRPGRTNMLLGDQP